MLSENETIERIEGCIRCAKVVVRPSDNGTMVTIFAEDLQYEKPGKRYLFMIEFPVEAFRKFFDDGIQLMPPIKLMVDPDAPSSAG